MLGVNGFGVLGRFTGCNPEIKTQGMDMPHCGNDSFLSHVFSFRFSYKIHAHTHIATLFKYDPLLVVANVSLPPGSPKRYPNSRLFSTPTFIHISESTASQRQELRSPQLLPLSSAKGRVGIVNILDHICGPPTSRRNMVSRRRLLLVCVRWWTFKNVTA